MSRKISIVGAVVLRDVKVVFVAVDNEWNFRNVAFVNSKTRDVSFGGPAAQMFCSFFKPVRQ